MSKKNIFNFPSFEPIRFNTSNAFSSPEIISMEELNEKQIGAVNSVLEFLKTQSDTANKQFKTSRNLIIATIAIMILQIGQTIWVNIETSSKQKSLNSIIEIQSKQSETISRMSLSLLDLQNQVLTLEKENKLLSKD